MSPESTTPATEGGDINALLTKANNLISPREHVVASTVAGNIWQTSKSVWEAIKRVTATVIDTPFSLLEAGVALPNNIVGLTTEAIDKFFVQNVNMVRSKIFSVLTKPSEALGASSAA